MVLIANGAFLFLILVFLVPVFGECPHGHSHDSHGSHGHDHHHHEEPVEPPTFRYSKEANEAAAAQFKNAGPKVKSTDHHDHSHHDHHHHEPKPTAPTSVKKSASDIWVSALGSTLLISLAPFFILFFIPLDNSEAKRPYLKILLSFASGGLLGDAFLHLIPHALLAQQSQQEEHGHSHSHHGHSHGDGEEHGPHDISVGLWVLAGIIAFLMVEKIVRIIKGPGGHGHSHGPVTDANGSAQKAAAKKANKKKKAKDSDEEQEEDEVSKEVTDHDEPEGKTLDTD